MKNYQILQLQHQALIFTAFIILSKKLLFVYRGKAIPLSFPEDSVAETLTDNAFPCLF